MCGRDGGNINNESWTGVEWENHWAEFLHRRAKDRNTTIQVTNLHMRPWVTVRRFWRNLFASCAASRFHRPADDRWGIGLSPTAQAQLKAMRMLLDELDAFSCVPHNGLLMPLDISSEAYCLADLGRHAHSDSDRSTNARMRYPPHDGQMGSKPKEGD